MSLASNNARFQELELESRAITSKLLNLVERRVAVHRVGVQLLPNPELFNLQDFDAYIISSGEALMVQLNQVLVDMSLAIAKQPGTNQALLYQQEYHRKMQLMETMQSIGEFEIGEDVKFFTSFAQAWRSDSPFGLV